VANLAAREEILYSRFLNVGKCVALLFTCYVEEIFGEDHLNCCIYYPFHKPPHPSLSLRVDI
jgi:hypothetical protein